MRCRLMLLVPLLGLPACTVETLSDRPAPAYTRASPTGTGYAAAAPEVIAPVPGSYCEEAVAVAQDAAAQAAYSGSARDVGRAERTAGYARRDCR